MRVRAVLLIALGLPLAGCADKTTNPIIDGIPPVVNHAWSGPYSGASNGDLILDVVQHGTTVTGEIVYGGGGEVTQHFFLLGTRTADDSLHLGLDPAHGPYTFTFTLAAHVNGNVGVDGYMRLSFGGFAADIHALTVPRIQPVLEATFDVPYPVIAMAFDDTNLWLATSSDADYVRMTTGGAVVDSVHIFLHDNVHWTSSTLAWDGSEMWGTYPVTVQSAGGNVDASEVLGFKATGRTGDSLWVWHRVSGLAYDGTDFWSLGTVGPTLRKFDRTGAVLDSAHVRVPDAVHLDLGNGLLLTLGFDMHRLYVIRTDGSVAGIATLPGPQTSLVAGMATDGPDVWVAQSQGGYTTLYRMNVFGLPYPRMLARR